MSRLRSLSLGAKINIALLVFLLALAGAASGIIFYGFRRAQDDASARSQRALEEQGKLALQAFVGGISSIGAVQLESGGEAGRRAASYLTAQTQAPASGPSPASGLEVATTGEWFDARPGRTTDLVVPGGADPTAPAVSADIAYSAPLDTVFPIVLQGFAGQAGGEGFDPAAISFTSTSGVLRSYPVAGAGNALAADADFAERARLVGPENNPERRTVWAPPHESGTPLGLVVTASTPVYDGETFRGIIDVRFAFAGVIAALNGVQPTPRGFAFYVDSVGVLARTTQYDVLTREAQRNAQMAGIIAAMGAAKPQFPLAVEKVELEGEPYFISYTPSGEPGGSVAAAAPVSDITGQASLITAGISDEGTRTLRMMLVALGALFVAGLGGATYLNRQLLVAPLRRLTSATRQVAGGDLTATVALGRRDEFGALAADFNVMVEQLRESERALEQRVADRTREIAGLLEVTRVVSSTLQVQPLLELVLDQTLGVLPYDRAAIMLREGEDLHMLAVRAGAGEPDDTLTAQVGMRLRLADVGVVWAACARGEPVVIDDVQAGDGLAAAYREEVGPYIGPAVGRFRTWMGIPLMVKGEPAGLMALARTMAGGYAPEHAALGKAIASQVAIAIENARLFEQARQTASLEERQRLARELHDSVSQALYGIALGTRTARLRLGDDPHDAAEPIDYVASLAQAGLAEMRALIFELRPESLEQEGLVAAIEKQAASVAARYKLDVALDLGEEPACALDIKEALYRIAQEALHNVVKHAQAAHVEIRLRAAAGGLELVIRDDGLGFDAAQAFPGHVGLQSMPERARKLGGAVVIDSAPGAGTTVTATVPAA